MRARALLIVLLIFLSIAGAKLFREASSAEVFLGFIRVAGMCLHVDDEVRLSCYESAVPDLYPQLAVPALYEVVSMLQRYDPVAYYCHVIAHEIAGRVAEADPSRWYEHLWDGPDSDQCTYGFFHGLKLTAFRDRNLDEDEIERLIPLFARLCTTPDSMSNSHRELGRRVNCNHGLGHMYYYVTQADVQEALNLCDITVPVTEDLPFTQGRAHCHEGALMQHFYRQEPEDFKEVRPEWTVATARPFCASLNKDTHRAACIRSMRFLMLDKIERGEGMVELCDAQPSAEERRFCFGRIMSALLIQVSYDPEALMRGCAGMPDEYRKICIGHSAVSIVGNRGGVAGVPDARHLCRLAERADDRQWCYESVAHHAPFYADAHSSDRKEYCRYLPVEYRHMCQAFDRAPLPL